MYIVSETATMQTFSVRTKPPREKLQAEERAKQLS